MTFIPEPFPDAQRPRTRSTPQRDAPASLSTATSLACAVGFRQARDRLLAQFEPAGFALVSAAEAPQPAECRPRFIRYAHPLETPLCWLSSAAALGWVLLAILSR